MLEDLSRQAPSLVPLKLSHDRRENGAVGSSPDDEFPLRCSLFHAAR
jgi:hypothetical protein